MIEGAITVIAVAAVVGIALLLLWRPKVLYCPSCGNAITNPYDDTYMAGGRTFHIVMRACPIYRDQRGTGWARHYVEIVRRSVDEPEFDPYTGEKR